jgi:hypothetical protein
MTKGGDGQKILAEAASCTMYLKVKGPVSGKLAGPIRKSMQTDRDESQA